MRRPVDGPRDRVLSHGFEIYAGDYDDDDHVQALAFACCAGL
jgi:hypothetical protein